MRILAWALVPALVLSGCLSGDDSEPTPGPGNPGTPEPTAGPTPPPTASPTPTPSPGPGGGGPTNREPFGSIAANLPNGTGSLDVVFTLKGTDADEDPLAWHLDLGDGNTTDGDGGDLPATVRHSYNSTGLYNVTYLLSDGEDTVEYLVALNLTPVELTVTHVVEGNTTQPGNPLAGAAAGAAACLGFAAAMDEVDCTFGDIPQELAGHAFSFTSDAEAPLYELWDACDWVDGTQVQAMGSAAEGSLPAGAGCVIMWNDGQEAATFRFEVR